MKSHGWLGAVCIVLVSVAARGAEEPPRVGLRGEPSRWVIEGAKTFTADEILAALAGSFDVAAACDKDAPLDALTAAIADKTSGGYQQAGFPDAKVAVAADGDHVTVTIEEGARYTQGEVRMHGNQAIDGDRIRAVLTDPSNGNKRAVWRGEGPAWFNPEANDRLKAMVAELAEEQGFYRASFNVSVQPDRETKKGTLDIEFVDEGTRATLEDVEIAAGDTNPPEKVLAHLELDAQTPLTSEVRTRVSRQLLSSGRFLRVQWKLGEADKRDESWRPSLALTEYEQAPPLDAPLTREEAALLKLAEWIERFDESDDEIHLRFPKESIAMILAPRHGYIIEYQPPLDAAGDQAGEGPRGAVVMAEERVGLYSAARRRKIDAAPPPAPIRGNAEITLITGGSRMKGGGRLTFGAGLWRSSSSPRRHVDIKLKLTAAAALSVVRTHHAKVDWDGDVVCFDWKYRQMRVNASTGQLIEQIVRTAIDDDGNADPDNSFVPHIKVGTGQFARQLAEIEKLSADWPNAADGQRPLSCLSEFLCQELQHIDADSKSGYAAIGKLVSQGLLRPFDELVAKIGRPDKDHFTVPQPYFQFHFNSAPQLFALAGKLSRIWGVRLGDWLFSNDGWTRAVWRDGVFLLAGKGGEATKDLWRKMYEGRGPLCALAAAEMLHAAGSNHFAEHCAGRGLRRLSPADFHKDCRDLLSGSGFVSQCLLRAVAAASQLDPADVQAISDLLKRMEVLDDSQAGVFTLVASALRGGDPANPSETAAKTLDALWAAGLSTCVERRLQTLALPPALPEPPAQAAKDDATKTAESLPPRPQDTKPAPKIAGYGVAPPEAPLGRYRPPANEQMPAPPTRPETSIKKEVRELQLLANALTDRLTNLEERLVSNLNYDANCAAPMVSEGPPVGLAESDLRLFFHGHTGLAFVHKTSLPPQPLPMILQLGCDQVSDFSLVGIHGHENERLDVVIHSALALPDGLSEFMGNGVPLKFEDSDLNAALTGHTVTTVVLYKKDAEGYRRIETRTSAEDRAQVISEASRQGVVLAVLSMSKEAWRNAPAVMATKHQPRDTTRD